MQFSWAVTVALLSVSLWGQQNYTMKNSTPQKKSTKAGKTATVSGNPSKDVQALERQQAKASASAPTAATKTNPALKPVKEKPDRPINLKGSGVGKIPVKRSGLKSNTGKDPYQGRLRQKHAHQ